MLRQKVKLIGNNQESSVLEIRILIRTSFQTYWGVGEDERWTQNSICNCKPMFNNPKKIDNLKSDLSYSMIKNALIL